MDIKVVSHTTQKELPKEVKEFFLKMRCEHELGYEGTQVAELFQISVNMHCDFALVQSRTSTYDRSKHYLEQ